MQISLRRKAPPKISPSKRAFEKYKPRGLFTEFYGTDVLFKEHEILKFSDIYFQIIFMILFTLASQIHLHDTRNSSFFIYIIVKLIFKNSQFGFKGP